MQGCTKPNLLCSLPLYVCCIFFPTGHLLYQSSRLCSVPLDQKIGGSLAVRNLLLSSQWSMLDDSITVAHWAAISTILQSCISYTSMCIIRLIRLRYVYIYIVYIYIVYIIIVYYCILLLYIMYIMCIMCISNCQFM